MGLGAGVLALLGVDAASAGAALGVGAGAIDAAAGAVAGAGLGAGEAALTGGDPGQGALFGGIGGAAGPLLGGVGDLFGGAAGDLGGAASGAAADASVAAGNQIAPAALGSFSDALPGAGSVGAGGDITSIAGATGAAGAGGSAIAPAALDLSTATPGAVSAGSNLFSPTAGTGSALTAPGVASGAGDLTGTGGLTGIPSSGLAVQPTTPLNTSPLSGVTTDLPGGDGSFGSRALSYVGNHPSLALGGLGLGASLLMNSSVPGLDSLQTEASLLAGKGNAAAGALQSGQLPQGAQASLDQATEAAKATMRSRFAGLGLSGSTQEAEALAGVDQSAAAQKYQMLLELTQTGLGELGQANTLYGSILNAEVTQDANASQAISRFAGALAGGAGA